jgi:hypothetical protein
VSNGILIINTGIIYPFLALEQIQQLFNSTTTDFINALPGKSSVNTAQHATIDGAVFSMSSAPSTVEQRRYATRF